MSKFSTIDQAIEDIKMGKMLILVDSPTRENEGDLYLPADNVNAKAINCMIRYGGGLICCSITPAQAIRLQLPLMVDTLENTEKTHVNFTVSVNSRLGITTGVSAFDRAKTIRVLANPKSKVSDLVKPGHIFPLLAKGGGSLERNGHTEAAVDLARLANLNPSGVLCEILREDGQIAKLPDLINLAHKLNIKMVAIDDLVSYLKRAPLPKLPAGIEVVRAAFSNLPTKYGKFQIFIYKSIIDNREHAALVMGDAKMRQLVRIHSQCLSGDTLFSLRCDCGEQLGQSLDLISKTGNGAILYLNQEGRGIGLINKIKSYALQDMGKDTVEANHALGLPTDARGYKIAADILKDLGFYQINLLTNNPDKVNQLLLQGIDVVKTTPLETKPNKINYQYLATKKRKLSHRLRLV